MAVPFVTTKAAIQAMHPCVDRWRVFCAAHVVADDATVSLESILDSNGESDTRWVLARMGDPGQAALAAFGSWCAMQVLPNYEKLYPNDNRVRKAIEAAQAFALNPSEETRSAARSAADSAADSANSADSAAYSADSAARSADSAADSAYSAAYSAWSAYSAADSAYSAWSAADSAQTIALRHICRGEFAALDRLTYGGTK